MEFDFYEANLLKLVIVEFIRYWARKKAAQMSIENFALFLSQTFKLYFPKKIPSH